MRQSTPSGIRHAYFQGMPWYDNLDKPKDPSVSSAWFAAKRQDRTWYVDLLESALEFGDSVGLRDQYRERFAVIAPADLTPVRAQAEGRKVSGPLWEIASELIAGRYLNRVCGWKLLDHEPPGNKECLGDWEFEAPNRRTVFVEVKFLQEPEAVPTNAMAPWPDYRPKIRSALARAYRQLPDDGRGTLVVIVGEQATEIPAGIMTGDIFEALFGKTQVRFTIEDPDSMTIGPAFHDMFVQTAKHRRIGAVAGLGLRGFVNPDFQAHAVHNPYSYEGVRLSTAQFAPLHQFHVDSEGRAIFTSGENRDQIWDRFAAA